MYCSTFTVQVNVQCNVHICFQTSDMLKLVSLAFILNIVKCSPTYKKVVVLKQQKQDNLLTLFMDGKQCLMKEELKRIGP